MEKRAKAGKYIDPTTDYGFKRIFGTDVNKDLLISLLNELFQGRKKIMDLTYGNTSQVGEAEEVGTVVFDIFCTGDKGEEFVVEMQTSTQPNLRKRMLYYASRIVSQQGKNGESKKWRHGVGEVYVVVLMDGFAMPGADYGPEFLNEVCLFHKRSRLPFDEGFGYIYVELVKFTKSEGELDTDLDRWMYVLKNMSKMDKIPVYLRKPIFDKLFNIAEYAKLSKEDRTMYDTSLLRKLNMEDALDGARLEGIERGIEQERARAESERLKYALNFKKSGFSTKDIANNLGLTPEQIERL